jgi:hypothetical protein
MERLRSVLLVLDGGKEDDSLVEKVVRLARPHDAQIQLFSCDWESARFLGRSYDQRDAAQVRALSIARQLQHQQTLQIRLRREGLKADCEAAWEPSHYEAIVRMAMRCRPDLVVKRVGVPESGRQSTLTASDWQLVRTCPAPLLLSRPECWAERPQIAAVLDAGQEGVALSATIVRMAECMRALCDGDLALLFGEEISEPGQRAVHSRQCGSRAYDLIVLGATTRGQRVTELVGTLARDLIETLASDLLLLPSRRRSRSTRTELRVLSVRTARLEPPEPLSGLRGRDSIHR